MKYLKIFEKFNKIDIDTILDLFLDIKDKYDLCQIDKDPFLKGTIFIQKEDFYNSFIVSNHFNDTIKTNQYDNFHIVMYIKANYDLDDNRVIYSKECEDILENEYPEIIADLGNYSKSVNSFCESIGYKAKENVYTTFIKCWDFNVISINLIFNIYEYKEKNKKNTEIFLKNLNLNSDMKDKLKKIGYNL
jgi:hypothetical protein